VVSHFLPVERNRGVGVITPTKGAGLTSQPRTYSPKPLIAPT
jgi:hypothetical protein